MLAVLKSAKTLLCYPFGGFMKRVPLSDAPTGGHGEPKGRHGAAAAIVCHRHGQGAPTVPPTGGSRDHDVRKKIYAT